MNVRGHLFQSIGARFLESYFKMAPMFGIVQVLDAAVGRLQTARPLPSEDGSTSAVETPDNGSDNASQLGIESDGDDDLAENWADGGAAVSQILGVFDLRGLGPQSLDFEFVAFLIETIYRCVCRQAPISKPCDAC